VSCGIPNGRFEVPLDNLVVDGALQPRLGGLDPAHVAGLVENPDAWPPLAVVAQQGVYLLVDGFHRLAAAKRLGLGSVAVGCVEAPADDDLRSLAFGLNARHGRPLSLADRRAEAVRLLRLAPDRSSRSIGKACGLNHETVERLRARAAASGEIRQTETRSGEREGGYHYRAPVRKPGELARDGVGELLQTTLVGLVNGGQVAGLRRSVSYLRRVTDAIEEQFGLPDWRADVLAEAALEQLGEVETSILAARLGTGALNLLRVARRLGYSVEAE
jgi:ParB/Sulfiredoxin domain